MYEVRVEAGFAAGHYLRNYRGKCENPHGHNYKVQVTLRGAELDAAGLLLDFKLLKQVMRPVIDRLDHQMMNDIEPFTTLNPSAENIAKYFYDQTNRELKDLTQGRVSVKDVVDGSVATVSAKFVFIGAGGGALPLLQKTGIPESKGYAGFPVSGIWLRCDDPDVNKRHHAKVYGKAPHGTPPRLRCKAIRPRSRWISAISGSSIPPDDALSSSFSAA